MTDNTFPQYSLLQLRAKARLGIAGKAMLAEIARREAEASARIDLANKWLAEDLADGTLSEGVWP